MGVYAIKTCEAFLKDNQSEANNRLKISLGVSKPIMDFERDG